MLLSLIIHLGKSHLKLSNLRAVCSSAFKHPLEKMAPLSRQIPRASVSKWDSVREGTNWGLLSVVVQYWYPSERLRNCWRTNFRNRLSSFGGRYVSGRFVPKDGAPDVNNGRVIIRVTSVPHSLRHWRHHCWWSSDQMTIFLAKLINEALP